MALGVFLIFFAFIVSYVARHVSNIQESVSSSEIKTFAYDYFKKLFQSKGSPTGWETGGNPSSIGLISDLYRIPLLFNETNGTQRTNVTLNVSLSFDKSCENKAWNNTVRVYENSSELPSQLYNQTFCGGQYLNTSNLFFNASFSPSQNKTFFVYFSNESAVGSSNYPVPFTSATNFTVQLYPEEKIAALSASKLNAMREMTYNDVMTSLGSADFKVEISEE